MCIPHTGPSIGWCMIHLYIRFFIVLITGEGDIAFTEGTTQGDPLVMAMYALAVIPLIILLCHHQPVVSQAWFADDAHATAAGQLTPPLQF